MAFIIRPKDTNRVSNNPTSSAAMHAEETQVVQDYENEYTTRSGVASHYRDPKAREAHPSDPLPPGNWRGPSTRPGSLKSK